MRHVAGNINNDTEPFENFKTQSLILTTIKNSVKGHILFKNTRYECFDIPYKKSLT